jgi:hypothetical protein
LYKREWIDNIKLCYFPGCLYQKEEKVRDAYLALVFKWFVNPDAAEMAESLYPSAIKSTGFEYSKWQSRRQLFF